LRDLANNLSKPEREFCVGGPIPREGYYALRDRPEVGNILDKIEKGKYFVIYAARQVGKTSLIQEVVEKLSGDGEYLPLYLTFQHFSASLSEEAFYQALARMVPFEIEVSLRSKGIEEKFKVEADEFSSVHSFISLLENIHRRVPYRLCLFIDEFEDIPQEVLDEFLRALRSIYLRKQRDEIYNILHSVGVIGVHSISQVTFAKTSSPFNIHESISIANFTVEQVGELLMQYANETGEIFPENSIEFIADKTGGQPYLVNLVAKILTTEIKPYTESRRMSYSDVETAYMKMLTMRGNTNFDSIVKHLRSNEEKYKNLLLRIIYQENVEFNPRNEIIEELVTLGIVKEQNNACAISSPAYSTLIIDCYKPLINGDVHEYFPEGYQPLFDEEGYIKPHPVIENFQYFLPQACSG